MTLNSLSFPKMIRHFFLSHSFFSFFFFCGFVIIIYYSFQVTIWDMGLEPDDGEEPSEFPPQLFFVHQVCFFSILSLSFITT